MLLRSSTRSSHELHSHPVVRYTARSMQATVAERIPEVMIEAAKPEARPRLYIPALDGIRFLAFALVFIHHSDILDDAKTLMPAAGPAYKLVQTWGWSGVDVFLTLSGFLIALLLLREIDATGGLSVPRFYTRRILRIWPLFYLMLV